VSVSGQIWLPDPCFATLVIAFGSSTKELAA